MNMDDNDSYEDLEEYYNEDEPLLSAWCVWAFFHGKNGERWIELTKHLGGLL